MTELKVIVLGKKVRFDCSYESGRITYDANACDISQIHIYNFDNKFQAVLFNRKLTGLIKKYNLDVMISIGSGWIW